MEEWQKFNVLVTYLAEVEAPDADAALNAAKAVHGQRPVVWSVMSTSARPPPTGDRGDTMSAIDDLLAWARAHSESAGDDEMVARAEAALAAPQEQTPAEPVSNGYKLPLAPEQTPTLANAMGATGADVRDDAMAYLARIDPQEQAPEAPAWRSVGDCCDPNCDHPGHAVPATPTPEVDRG